MSAPARRPVAALAARLRPGLGAAATGNVGTTRQSHSPRSPFEFRETSRRQTGGGARTGCRSSRAGQPGARSLAGPLSYLDEAPLRDRVRRGRGGGPRRAAGSARLRRHPGAVRPAHQRVPAHPAQDCRHGSLAQRGHARGAAARTAHRSGPGGVPTALARLSERRRLAARPEFSAGLGRCSRLSDRRRRQVDWAAARRMMASVAGPGAPSPTVVGRTADDIAGRSG